MGTRALLGIRLEPLEYLTHGVYFGQTGKGKTYALATQMDGLRRCGKVSFIWFSVKRHDPDFLRSLGMDDVLVLECGAEGNNFRLDPFCLLDGVDLPRQIESLTGALRVLAMELPTFGFLRPIVAELMMAKRAGRAVSLLDLYGQIKGAKASPMQGALMNRLDLILERSDSSMFHAPGPFPFGTLMRTNVMLRLGSLGYYAQLFLVNLVVAKALAWRGAREGRGCADDDGHIVVIVVDEAFLFADPAHIDHDAPLRVLFQMGREWKLCGLLVTARPSDLAPVFLAQAGLVMSSNVTGGSDLMAVKLAMGLDEEQARMLTDMPRQCFLFKKRNVPAFPVHIPTLNIDRSEPFITSVWNARVIEGNPECADVLYRPEEGIPDAGAADGGVPGPSVVQEDVKVGAAVPAVAEVVETDEAVFVRAVNENPFATTQEVYESLRGRLGQFDANKIRKRLIASGDLAVHKVKTGARGFVNSMELTEQGLRRFGLKAPAACGRGGYEHQFLVARLGKRFEAQGKNVSREHKLGSSAEGGRLADLWLTPDCWAVQVAIHNQSTKEVAAIVELAGVEGVRRVLVVCNDKKHKEALEDDLVGCLAPGASAEVAVCLACELLRDVEGEATDG